MLAFLNRFSLDISLSALAVSLLLGKLTTTEISAAYPLLLFFATATIYNLDHYFDRYYKKRDKHKLKPTTSFARATLLSVFTLIACAAYFSFKGQLLAISDFSALQLSLVIVVLLASAVHLLLSHLYRERFANFKELSVALVFAVGVFIPLLLADEQAALAMLKNDPTVLLALMLTLLHNALLFSFFSFIDDVKYAHPTILANMPKELFRKSFTILGLFALIMALSYPPENALPLWKYYLPACLMAQGILFRIYVRQSSLLDRFDAKQDGSDNKGMLADDALKERNHRERNHRERNHRERNHPAFTFLGNFHFTLWYALFLLLT